MIKIPKWSGIAFGAGLVVYMIGEVFEYLALLGCECYQPTVFVLLGIPLYLGVGVYLIAAAIGVREGK